MCDAVSAKCVTLGFAVLNALQLNPLHRGEPG